MSITSLHLSHVVEEHFTFVMIWTPPPFLLSTFPFAKSFWHGREEDTAIRYEVSLSANQSTRGTQQPTILTSWLLLSTFALGPLLTYLTH